MATMTMVEAESIINIVSEALLDTSHCRHPVSALQGHDIYSILTAAKLCIAKEFMVLSWQQDFEKQFADGVALYAGLPGVLALNFVPDHQVDITFPDFPEYVFDTIDPSSRMYKDERLASEETATSFGDYCRSIGTDDPIYWQKIYTRLGLEYTSTSPKGNTLP